MKKQQFELAVYATNASQYHVPIYRALEADKNISLTVMYGSDVGIKEFYDEQSSSLIDWDIDLSYGYKYKIFRNLASRNSRNFFRAVNFGIIPWLYKNRYDLVLINGYNTFSSWLVLITCKILKVKLVWRGEALIPLDKPNFLLSSLKKIILPIYFSCFDFVFYSCHGNKKYLEQFVLKKEKLKLFPCAVDNNFFSDIKLKEGIKREQIRNSYGIEEDDIVILFAARFINRKRPYDLIDAVSRLRNPKIVLLFCGDGPERNKMEGATKQYSIRSVFTGLLGQKELAKHYMIADIYALLSDYDASPKTLNEALNFGVPLIASNMLGNAPDILIEGKNGFIVEVGNISQASEKLSYLCENLEEMKKSSMEISKSLLPRWSIEEDVNSIKDLLDS